MALPPAGRREAAPNLIRRVRWAELWRRGCGSRSARTAHALRVAARRALCTGVQPHGQLGAGQDWQKVMAPRRVDVVVEDEGVPPPAHHPHFALGDEPPLEVGAAVYPVEVVAGGNHSLMIDSAGSVWSWGVGVNGRLGHGDTAWLARPKRILTTRVLQRPQLKIVQVSAGLTHNLMLNGCGVVFAFGANTLRSASATTASATTGSSQSDQPDDRCRRWSWQPPRRRRHRRRHPPAAVCEGFVDVDTALDGRLGHGDDRNQHKPTRVPSLAWAENSASEPRRRRPAHAVRYRGRRALCDGPGKHGRLGLNDTVSRWRRRWWPPSQARARSDRERGARPRRS